MAPGHPLEVINERTWFLTPAGDAESPDDAYLRGTCLTYSGTSLDLTLSPPPEPGLAVAAVRGDVEAVRRLLAETPGLASERTGPHGWSPLMYLAYGRVETDRAASLEVARLLVDSGADPNDGRFFSGLATPFTVLTGVLGGGERDECPHRHAIPLARLLLERGAEANDAQAVYNRMFTDDDKVFELLFAFGLGSGDGGPWRRLLPDLLSAPSDLLAGLLSWAVDHDRQARVALLARHGVDLARPLPSGATPLKTALGNGNAELAEFLRDHGAPEPELDPVETFVVAALSGNDRSAAASPDSVLAAARQSRPSLVVWAAGQGRLEAVRLLVGLGWDVNALGRSDVQREQPWQSALHTAVERDDLAMAELLLELGADTSIRDARFDGTALDWAGHLGRPELAAFLCARLQP